MKAIEESIKKVIKNILFFLVLIVITYIIVFKNYNIKQTIDMISNANIVYILLAILCMFLYLLCESINNRWILESFGKKISIFRAIKYSLIGFFFSGITPASGGGQPMEVYYMSKDKIPSSYATLSLLIQMIIFHVITLIFAIIGAIINRNLLSSGMVIILIYGLIIKIIILTLMIVCFRNRYASKKIIDFTIKIMKKLHIKNIDEKEKQFRSIQEDYNNGAKFIRTHKNIFKRLIIFVLLQVIAYYTIPYFIYRSFDLNTISWFTIITIQAVLYCSVASVPLPGAVGVSEGAFLSIYKMIFGESMLASAMIINRTISFYLIIFIASIVVSINSIRLTNKKNR